MTTPIAHPVQSIDTKVMVGNLLPGWKLGESNLSTVGVTYRLDGEKPGQSLHLSLAAVENPGEAKRLFDHVTIMTSIGPRVSDQSLGDGIRIWGQPDKIGGPLIYRRGNVFMELTGDMLPEGLLDFARKFDAGLSTGAPWIKTTTDLVAPSVEMIHPPASLSAGEAVKIRLQVSPGAPEEMLLAGGDTHALVQAGPEPLLTYYAPGQAGEDAFSIFIATRGNLFAERKFTLHIR